MDTASQLHDLFWIHPCRSSAALNSPDRIFQLMTLTLIHPASKWMHRATLRRHSGLFRAATSASSQASPILNKSLLTMLLQLVRGRPGPLLNPGTSQCSACWGICCWSMRITCPSQQSSFTEYIIHAVLPSSGSNLFVCYAILPGDAQDTPLLSMMSGVQSFRQCCC